ncbi:MAG TPA: hypothetical protein VKM54_10340 [Myxococcota bacterium]|nr:hypothetical protein [Myxococcota bacterium]
MPFPPLHLASEDERRLVRLCRRRPLPQPTGVAEIQVASDLPARRRFESTWFRSWRFATESSARRWNDNWARVVEDLGFVHPALVTMHGGPITDPTLEYVARIASQIMHEEIRAGTPLPSVALGWQVELVVSHVYETMPSTFMRDSLVITTSWSVLDADREPLWCVDSGRDYELRLLPANAPQLLTAKHRFETVEVDRFE